MSWGSAQITLTDSSPPDTEGAAGASGLRRTRPSSDVVCLLPSTSDRLVSLKYEPVFESLYWRS